MNKPFGIFQLTSSTSASSSTGSSTTSSTTGTSTTETSTKHDQPIESLESQLLPGGGVGDFGLGLTRGTSF